MLVYIMKTATFVFTIDIFFEANGCKFAPVNVASKFAREATLPDSEKETFGFHYHFQEYDESKSVPTVVESMG